MHKPTLSNKPAGVPGRQLWLGVCFWAVFAVVAVALRGVRWEENYERAQLMLGLTPYPVEHPFYQYTYAVMSIHYILTAAFMRWVADPAIVCGAWNVLFLLGVVAPMFLLTSLLTRRAVWGHIAATLMFLEVQTRFAPYYPLGAWPDQFSIGQIGMASALLCVFLLAGGRWRWGFLLIGLMPLIHIGHAPVPYAVGTLFVLWQWRQGNGKELLACGRWFAAGFAVSLAFWIVKPLAFSLPPVTEGPYFSSINAGEVWRTYVFTHDVHRAIPRFAPLGNAILMNLAALALGIGAARLEWRRGRGGGPYAWCLACTAMAFAGGGACYLTYLILGDRMPYVLLAWIPYRLFNYAVLIAVVTSLGLLADDAEDGEPRRAGGVWMAFLLAYVLLWPLLSHVIPERVFTRYIQLPEGILFLMMGGAAGVLLSRLRGDGGFAILWALCAGAGIVSIAFYHQFGAFCIVVGCVAVWTIAALGRWRVVTALGRPAVAWVLCAMLLAGLTFEQWRTRNHLPGDPLDAKVTAYLAEHAEPGAMILGPHSEIRLQERLNHPTLVTFETCHHMAYVPKIGPTVAKMYDELFDIRFDAYWDYRLDAWARRGRARWQELAAIYHFRHVICPNGYTLDLPAVLRGDAYTLYEIPEAP
ncbi:MAG: hypothetical protein GWP08_03505 [Nitrospiraceae bacterium]|nr:hypothetical protein [Nitrospiraceae bacterium]